MRASDDDDGILAVGRGDAELLVLSLSAAAADGDDDGYLAWHLLDHLPEQHRIAGLRNAQRWRATGDPRLRLAAEPPYDAVEHAVGYLFGGDVDAALAAFFRLGAALREAGRMPRLLPSVELGVWARVASTAAPRVLAGADVIPWRPHRGVMVIIEPACADDDGGDGLDALVGIDGVAGVWRFRDAAERAPHLGPATDRRLALCYLDDDPSRVCRGLEHSLRERWAQLEVTARMAMPLEVVTPWSWER
jgi:hypothetical protein